MGVTSSVPRASIHARSLAERNSGAPSTVIFLGAPNMLKNSSSKAEMVHAAVRSGNTAIVTNPEKRSTIKSS